MRVSALPMISEPERHELVGGMEPDRCQYNFLTIVFRTLFEVQAGRSPETIAVEADNKSLTYSELNGRANQLAGYLKKLGVRQETLVGVCRKHDWQNCDASTGHSQSWRSLRSVGPSVSPAAARFYGGGIQAFSSCSRKNIGRAYCRNIKERRFVLSGTGKRLRRKRKAIFRVRGLQIAWLMCSIPPVQPGGQRAFMGLQRGAMNRFGLDVERISLRTGRSCVPENLLELCRCGLGSIRTFAGGELRPSSSQRML